MYVFVEPLIVTYPRKVHIHGRDHGTWRKRQIGKMVSGEKGRKFLSQIHINVSG